MNHNLTRPTITIDRRSYDVHFIVPNDLIPQFTQLINRALNTNADCHPALKEFGDMLMHGRILQDYYSQRSDPHGNGRSVQEILLENTRFEILPEELPRFKL